jgi:NAD(P)-dependent dehydrogenase (short-subunit alcohol dehydrogenase family)
LIRAAGGTALFIQTDVGDEKSIQSMAEKTLEAFGKVDILVNNAILYHTGTILELPLEVWDQIYAVNLRGAVAAIQAFLPDMLERKQGTIVTLTSQEGMPYAVPYFASKAALQSLGLSLAAELGEESGVSAFVFAPGMVATPGGEQAFQAMAPRFGMTYQEFTSMGANPGYQGLMPGACGRKSPIMRAISIDWLTILREASKISGDLLRIPRRWRKRCRRWTTASRQSVH